MPVRVGMAVVVALLAGLVLGRLGPQEDLRKAKEQAVSLQKELAGRQRAGGATMLTGVRSMFGGSRQDLAAGAGVRRARAADALLTNEIGTATNEALRGRHAFSNQLAALKETWLLRSALARSNFMARVDLEAQQAADFDTTIEAMNLRVGATIDKWAARIRQEGSLSPESGVRIMNEVSQAMILAYDDLDRRLPPEWRQKAGPRFELMTFVDPEVLTPLQGFDQRLQPPEPW
ncbi:MAG: hypothetical protein NTV49_15580 [Kiritimatiellaeota bacterium]|nr:hypothetical protein [Kiritimatiellota bacterium]